MIARTVGVTVGVAALLMLVASVANAYEPPAQSTVLLLKVDFSAAVPVDEAYRREFVACDGGNAGLGRKDHFLGIDLERHGLPASKQYYLCSRDPSNVRALLKLSDGAIYWHSKMALDVDGSWASWNGLPGATDQKETSYKWPGVSPSSSQAAQIDPDRIPYIVMPMSGIERLTGSKSGMLGRMFADKTGLKLGDMGVVIYRDRWTPVIIGDGGPFMRLGEGSSRVFEALGESRCRKWSDDGQTCVGPGNAYPYRNSGIGRDVLFILYPGSSDGTITPGNALTKMCAFAKRKLGLVGGSMCSQ